MKAAVLHGPKDLHIEDVAVPEPGFGQVLVKIAATAICGTDVAIYEGKTPIAYPRVLGHESAGTVVKAGSPDCEYLVGEKVAVNPTTYCGQCPACMSGLTNVCERGGLFGREFDGTYAEYALAQKDAVIALPDELGFIESTGLTALGTVVYGQEKITVKPNTSVVVIGEGTTGLLHTRLSKLRGGNPIIGISRSQWKLDLAREYGADMVLGNDDRDVTEAVMELTGGLGADVVIESVGSGKTLSQATDLVRPGGTVLAFGITPPTIDGFKSYAFYYKDLTIVGTRAMRARDWKATIDLARKGQVDLKTLVTHKITLDQLLEGFELIHNKSTRVMRVVVEI